MGQKQSCKEILLEICDVVLPAISHTHPFEERRECIVNDEAHDGQWSLQGAVISALGLFVGKKQTIYHWQCGLDEELGTWRRSWFSKEKYDERLEKQTRREMIDYAVADCLVLDKLFNHMYPIEFENINVNVSSARTTRMVEMKPLKRTSSTSTKPSKRTQTTREDDVISYRRDDITSRVEKKRKKHVRDSR